MRKFKFFLSLLMLFSFSVGTVWGEDLYVYNGIGSTTAFTQTGGTAAGVPSTETSNLVVGNSQKGNYCIKINKGYSSKGGPYFIGVTLNNGVNAGDTVKIAYFRTSTSAAVLGMDFSADADHAATTYQILSQGDIQYSGSNFTPADSTYIVPTGVSGAKYMRIYRNSGSTGIYVAKLIISKRVESSDPSVTVEPAALNFGTPKLNEAIEAKTFALTGANLTDAKDVTVTAPTGFSVSIGEAAPAESLTITPSDGAIDETIIVTPSTAAYGVKDGNITISSDDLEADSTVALTMTVGGIVEITNLPDSWAFGEVLQGDDRMNYKKTFHLHVTNLSAYKELHVDCGAGFAASANPIADADGVVDADIEVYPSSTETPDSYTDRSLQLMCTGAREFSDYEITDAMSMTIVAAKAVTVPEITGGTMTWNGGEAPALVKVGATATLVATPTAPYTGGAIQIFNADNDDDVTDKVMEGSTLTMPEYAIKVVVTFSAPSCTELPAPTLDAVTKDYKSATIAWNAVEHADGYVLNIKQGETSVVTDELIVAPAVSFEKTGLAANTEYSYTVMAVGDGDSYCATSSNLLEGNFTTDELPAATLTLSENGVERAFAGSHKLNDVIALPTEVETNVLGKSLAGWSTVTFEATDTKPTENFYEPGAEFTLSAETQTIYAVYVAGHGAIDEWRVATSVTEGDVVVFSTHTGYTDHDMQTAGVFSGTNTYTSVTNSTYSTDKKTITTLAANTLQFTIGGNADDGWTLKNGTKYLAMTGDKKIALIAEDSTWVISFEGEKALVSEYFAGQSATYTMKYNYNSGNPRFTAYKTGQTDISLYKHIQEAANWNGYATSGPRALALPVFDPAQSATALVEPISVNITAAEGTIYYNINSDEDPTSESILYEGSIALKNYGSYTIKAIAIDGDNRSEVASATYMLNLPFASLEDLVAAGLGSNVENITVSFANAEIVSFNSSRKTITINVKDEGDKNIQIYNASTACPTAWAAGGQISGTVTGTWTMYNEARELVISSWEGISYKAPAGLAWSAAEVSAYTAGKAYELPTLSNPNNLPVTYNSSNFYALDIDENTGEISNLVAGQTTTITATFAGNDTYLAQSVSYTLSIYKPSSLAIAGELTKTEYDDGDTFVFDGLTANLTFTDETVEDVTADAEWLADGVATKVLAWPANSFYVQASYTGVPAVVKPVEISFKTYAVTFAAPEHGTLVVKKSGNPIGSGDTFVKNTTLTVEATPADNYKLTALTAGDEDILATKQFTVGTEAVVVAATIVEKDAAPISWTAATAKAYLPADLIENVLPTLNNENALDVYYSAIGDNPANVAEIDDNGVVTIKGAGTVTIRATYSTSDASEYRDTNVDYELTVYAPASAAIVGDAVTEYEYNDYFNTDVFAVKTTYADEAEITIPNDSLSWESTPGRVTENGNVHVVATNYEGFEVATDIAVTVKTHTVSFEHPEHGFISVKLGDDNINSGDAFVKGTELSVVLLGSYDYKAGGLIVTGATLENDLMTIGTENVVISGTVVEKPAAPIAWDIEGTEVNVTLGDWYQFPELVNDQHLDVFYSTTGDAEHVAEIDDNGVVTVKGAGTVTITASYLVSVESEYKTTDVSYTLTISEPQPYYMKNNWDGGDDWYWKPMTYFAGIYVLQNVVFGGSGVNYNTSDSDQGAQWRPVTGDNHIICDAGEIAAKDTIDFMLDPQLGTVTATNVRKYVAPAETKFYIAGSMTDWEAHMIAVTEDSYEMNLAAGSYQMKVVHNDNWIGYESVKPTDGLYTDEWGNVDFTLADAGTVTVTYIAGETFTVEGTFGKPESKLIGLKGWTEETDAILMENAAADYETASATVTIETAADYEFKLIFNGMWLGKNYNGEGEQVVISRENASVDALVSAGKDINFVYTEPYALKLNADMAGEYTFTWNYVTRTLTITYPELPAITYEIFGNFGDENAWIAVPMLEGEGAEAGTWSGACTLAANSEYKFKIRKMQGENALAWFGAQDKENEMKYGQSTGWTLASPGEDINLKTTTAASYTFEFTPEGNLLSVDIPKDATAIDGIDADEKAVKVIHNDMIYIIKGGKTYNITGQLVK